MAFENPHDGRTAAGATTVGAEFRVRGLVQGVGFRPAVWRVARRLGLAGTVLNDGAGVLIRVWGTTDDISAFETALLSERPPLARIESIQRTSVLEPGPSGPFVIAESRAGAVSTGIVPDAATCPECLAEVLDPVNRRYRYAFTNCTQCGPRLSIVKAIPYGRASTSMAAFPMCAACRSEYEDPADRRFHAEPIACPACGPRVWLEDGNGRELQPRPGFDAIAETAALLHESRIVAIKGIGGFHLGCDATDAAAVANLRRRKRRYHKPFALMARDIDVVRAFAHVSAAEAALLASPAAPIVVLDRRDDAPPLAPDVAPAQSTLGFMLPYTPLHHLVLRDVDRPIVLTSGNASDEPQCITNADARARLEDIADVWLMHDRDIVNRLDDSVARIVMNAPSVLRRARGWAPEPVLMPAEMAVGARVLALGAELKCTFCLFAGDRAMVSQHLGDLKDAAAHDDYRAALRLYRSLFDFDPEIIAVDLHPDYLSSQLGTALGATLQVPVVSILHHHAHVAAVLAEHGVAPGAPPVLGIVLDGLGLGENGELWGGEFMRADYSSSTRLAAFTPVPLIGGERAMREPWRNAFAHLHQFIGWSEILRGYDALDIVKFLQTKQPDILMRMMASGLNAPPASSAGRLFDAGAALLGICADAVSYEGQAAIELEALGAPRFAATRSGYPASILEEDIVRIGWRPFWQAMLDDLESGADRAVIAARFHRGIVDALARLAARLCTMHGLGTVVLSGGVFQNRLLLEGVAQALRDHDLEVLSPRRLPANDGGLSLGQAVIARALARRSD
jgi:hydrogenase maturation protein HypF